ncbi:MAG TPA: thermonuclease family protein [Actinomycetota bacterium]|nr:thermonuclease family protein [Actinomycetota bacterium]
MRPRVLVLVLVATLVACSPKVELLHQAPATFAEEPGGYEAAVVTNVVDGDTIDVEITDRVDGPGAGQASVGGEYRVRLIGIDTPETVKPGTPVQCFGREASAATHALLDDAEVRLVKDVEETDQYDRLLRYVYIGDEMANARLVANGYAYAFTYPPDVRHADLFVSLQRDAREHGRGLWSRDSCDGRR